MSKFKVSVEVTVPTFLGLLSDTKRGVYITEAGSLEEALEEATREARLRTAMEEDDTDAVITVTDVQEVL